MLDNRAAASGTMAPRRNLLGRLNLEIRENISFAHQLAIMLSGLAVGLLIAAVVLIAAGVGPADLVQEFVVAIFTNSRNLSAVLTYATPLVIVGLAASLAFKARFWNIGIEGQVIFGAIGATLIANHDIGPAPTRLLLMAIAAIVCGMAWIALPVFLKLRLKVNEIISTLLLNYIAFNFLLHLLYGPWKDPQSAFPHSKLYDEAERFAALGGLGVSQTVFVAILLVLLGIWLLSFSRFGFLVNFVNANTRMARAVGIRVGAITLAAALASGALSGLAGFTISAGIDNRMTQSFFVGYGFSGILIAFLARNNPIGVMLFAVLMAVLMVAGHSLQVFYRIPFAMVQVIQATIVICVAASDFFIRHRIRLVE
jgi:ABC-type uncharacterized transport system permease subunit